MNEFTQEVESRLSAFVSVGKKGSMFEWWISPDMDGSIETGAAPMYSNKAYETEEKARFAGIMALKAHRQDLVIAMEGETREAIVWRKKNTGK